MLPTDINSVRRLCICSGPGKGSSKLRVYPSCSETHCFVSVLFASSSQRYGSTILCPCTCSSTGFMGATGGPDVPEPLLAASSASTAIAKMKTAVKAKNVKRNPPGMRHLSGIGSVRLAKMEARWDERVAWSMSTHRVLGFGALAGLT